MAKKKEGVKEIKTNKRKPYSKKKVEVEEEVKSDNNVLSCDTVEYFVEFTPKTEETAKKEREEKAKREEMAKKEEESIEEVKEDNSENVAVEEKNLTEEKPKRKRNNFNSFTNVWNGVEMDLY